MSHNFRIPLAFALIVMVSCAVDGNGEESDDIIATQEAVTNIVVCPHYFPSLLDCDDVPGLAPEAKVVPIESVDSVQYGLFINGRWERRSFPMSDTDTAGNVDAIFFTTDIINKFAIPWYVSEAVSLDTLRAILNRIPADTL